MALNEIISALSRASTFDDALAYAVRDADFSVPDGLRVPLLAGLIQRRAEAGRPQAALVVTATGRDSENVRASLGCVLPDADVVEFPAWETLPHERLSPSAEIVGRRLDALRRMKQWSGERPLVVVASVRAALQPVADNLADIEPIRLVKGTRGYDLGRISAELVDLAYARVDMVTRRGEFAVRGGILDVFPAVAEHPSRVDFFGDEVDSIRAFSVADQRSLPGEIDSVLLPPSRELLLVPAVRQRAREMLHEFPSLSAMLAKIAEGIPVEGMESLAPALLERLVPISHYLPDGAAVAVLAPRARRDAGDQPRRDEPRVPAGGVECGDRRRRGSDRPRLRRIHLARRAARLRRTEHSGRRCSRSPVVDDEHVPPGPRRG